MMNLDPTLAGPTVYNMASSGSAGNAPSNVMKPFNSASDQHPGVVLHQHQEHPMQQQQQIALSTTSSCSASQMYALRRRSRLSDLSCGASKVFDCSSQTTVMESPASLTPLSKDSSNGWEQPHHHSTAPSTQAAVFQTGACTRRESDSDSLISLQAAASSSSHDEIDARRRLQAERGSGRRRAARRSLSCLPGQVRSRHSSVQPYHNKFSEEINKELYSWLNAHLEFPYPTDDQKSDLCRRTGLTKLQLRYWFTNVRRRTLPAIIQSHNEERQKKGQPPIKSRSRWESDPRHPPGKDGMSRPFNNHLESPHMSGRFESSAAEPMNAGLWSYSVQSRPPMSGENVDKSVSAPPGAAMATYCPIAAPQPVWHTASVAVAHLRNAVYTGMPYDGMASPNGTYSAAPTHPSINSPTATAMANSTCGGMQAPPTPSHLGPIVLTPASPHAQLSFQAHTQALYSPMEILPAVQSMGVPYSASLPTHSHSCFPTTAA